MLQAPVAFLDGLRGAKIILRGRTEAFDDGLGRKQSFNVLTCLQLIVLDDPHILATRLDNLQR